MEILLALAAAVSYGVSDFAGGVLTRRAHVFVVFLLSQLGPAAGGRGVVGGRRLVAGVGWGGGRPGRRGGHVPALPGLAIGRMSVVAEPEGGLRLALNPVERL